MKVALASDHAGREMKNELVRFVEQLGHTPLDRGPFSSEPVDYPDFAAKVGEALQRGEAERGIMLCGSGVGASIAANKMLGVRAAVCHDSYSAAQGVEHDDMNLLCLGARVIGIETARELVRRFLSASFSGEERHARRLAKVAALERRS